MKCGGESKKLIQVGNEGSIEGALR